MITPVLAATGQLTAALASRRKVVVSAPWTPLDLAALAAWYDGSDGATLFEDTAGLDAAEADDGVARINDKSGSGFHLTQATANSRPTLKAAIQNGLSVLRGDGMDFLDRTTTTILRNLGGATLASVHKITTPTTAQVQLFVARNVTGSGRAVIKGGVVSGQLRMSARRLDAVGADNLDGGVVGSSEWVIVIAYIDYAGAIARLYKNGAVVAFDNGWLTAGLTSNTDSAGISILAADDGAEKTTGDFGEALVIEEALSEADITALGNYLADKWGITWLDIPNDAVQIIDDASFTDCDCIALFDIDDDGLIDVVSANSSGAEALYWYEQVSPSSWTRHTISTTAGHFDGEIEGATALELDGKVYVVASGQDGGNLSIFTPTTPGSPTGSWTRAELLTGHAWLQTVWAYDLDGDGELEIIIANEGTDAASGGIYWLDYDGSDPMVAADWTKYTIIQHPGSFWIARDPIDISGSGRGDLVFSARNMTARNPNTDPGVYWLARPATVTDAWTKTEIDGRTADWHKVEVGNFFGDGHSKDVLAADVDGTFSIATYRFNSSYARTDIAPARPNGVWNLRKVPTANGMSPNSRDSFLAPHLNSYLYLYRYDGAQWTPHLLDSYPTTTHPMDNIILWHDVDGDGFDEAFIADSSDTDTKLVWINVETP